MKVKLFLFLIISAILIIGCSKPKKEFSYTLETTFSLGSEFSYFLAHTQTDRIILINDAVDKDMIQVYDFKGNLLEQFGNKGDGPNELAMPYSAWYNPDSFYVVYDFRHMKRFYFAGAYKSAKPETYLLTNHYEYNNKVMECALKFDANPGFHISINDSLIHQLSSSRKNWVAFSHANKSFITVNEQAVEDEQSILYLYDWDGVLLKTIKFPHDSASLVGTNSKYIILRFKNNRYDVYDLNGEFVSTFSGDAETERFIVGMNEKYLVWLDDSGEEETMLEVYRID